MDDASRDAMPAREPDEVPAQEPDAVPAQVPGATDADPAATRPVAASGARPSRRRRPNPMAELALPGNTIASEMRYPLVVSIVLSIVAVAFCYLLVGASFAIIGGGLVIATFSYRIDPGRPAAMGAFLLAVGAALATVVEFRPQSGDPTLLFATNRPGASTAGNMAGALFTVAAIMFGLTERAPAPRVVEPLVGPVRIVQAAVRRVDRAALIDIVTIGGAVVVGVVLRVALGVEAVPAASEGLVRNLEVGLGYGTTTISPGPTGLDVAPLGPVVAAYGPLGARVSLVVTGMAVVLLTSVLARRWRGAEAGRFAAVAAALLPAVWDAPLSVMLAAACVLGALIVWYPLGAATTVGTPDDFTSSSPGQGRGFATGILVGLAIVSRPDAILVVPVLVMAASLGSRHSSVVRQATITMVAAAALVVSPWVNLLWTHGSAPLLAASWRAWISDPGPQHGMPAVIILASNAVLVVAGMLAGPQHLARSPLVRQRGVSLPLVLLVAGSIMVGAGAIDDRGLFSWAAPVAVVLVAAHATAPAGRRRAAAPRPRPAVTPGA